MDWKMRLNWKLSPIGRKQATSQKTIIRWKEQEQDWDTRVSVRSLQTKWKRGWCQMKDCTAPTRAQKHELSSRFPTILINLYQPKRSHLIN